MFKNFLKNIYLKIFGRYQLLSLLSREIESRWRILDVGCGQSSLLQFIPKGENSWWVGLDYFEPYIIESRKKKIHDDYILSDARSLPFEDNSFDCAIAIEVIEHLNKSDGLKMIKEMERVAKKKIILTTPNGFFNALSGPDALNPQEKHISGWTVKDFKNLGFRIYGLGSLKIFWQAAPGKIIMKFKPRRLFILFAKIFAPFVYYYPSLAFRLFCIKDLEDKN